MKPALRDYLETLRQDSYVEVKPGYVDTAAVAERHSHRRSPAHARRRRRKERPAQALFGKKKNAGMKSAYVADLAPDTSITSFFLVAEKELRSTREGKPFCAWNWAIAAAPSRRASGKTPKLVATFDRDDIVKVQARVESYRNKTQLAVDRSAAPNPAKWIWPIISRTPPRTSTSSTPACANTPRPSAIPGCNRLVRERDRGPAIVPRLKRAPAAKMMHHAFLGGLLEHMVSLCDLCPSGRRALSRT